MLELARRVEAGQAARIAFEWVRLARQDDFTIRAGLDPQRIAHLQVTTGLSSQRSPVAYSDASWTRDHQRTVLAVASQA